MPVQTCRDDPLTVAAELNAKDSVRMRQVQHWQKCLRIPDNRRVPLARGANPLAVRTKFRRVKPDSATKCVPADLARFVIPYASGLKIFGYQDSLSVGAEPS